jgi:1,4-dihydroxy-6-naphthoate synthase
MLTLGFSTCPNDTFIFDAWVNQRLNQIDSAPIVHLGDVDELNIKSQSALYDITKLSFGAISDVSDKYQILDSGSALGFGCGPLLVSKQLIDVSNPAFNDLRIAIPGEKTTANLLLSMAFPKLKNKVVLLFSEIEDAILDGTVDAGLLIHENRFTYESLGLKKIIDLGEYWEQTTGHPIPLGCIAVRRDLPQIIKLNIQSTIRNSVEFAFKHPDSSSDYVAKNAQSMSPEVMKQHINLYVNEFSVSLGKRGKEAINRLFEEGKKAGLIGDIIQPIFL